LRAQVAFVLFDANLTLAYGGLSRTARYELTVRFARPYHTGTRGPTAAVRLVANGGIVVQPYAPAPVAEAAVYRLPAPATASGNLTLTCNMPPGVGGEGIGCGIAEVWLRVASAATDSPMH
jgi:hypothetical protein